MQGPELGGYRAHRPLGRGANTRVWQATAPDGSQVALKVYDGPFEACLSAAKREAALAAQVNHRHVIGVTAIVCDQQTVAVAMPLASGGSLAELLASRGQLPPEETLTILIPVASALATAHERGVVHGDLSPANIVFDVAGRPLLVDLGAAGIGVECGLDVQATPGYVAPEVARGETPDAAADVFSLGAIALRCLAGHPAWNANDLRDVVVQATVGQWPDLGDDAAPQPLVRLIRSMLVDVPGQRPGAATVSVELAESGTPAPVAFRAAAGVPAQGSAAAQGFEVMSAPVAQPAPTRRHQPGADEGAAGTGLAEGAGLGAAPTRPLRSKLLVAGGVVAALLIGLAAVQAGLWWGESSAQADARPASALESASSSSKEVPTTSADPLQRKPSAGAGSTVAGSSAATVRPSRIQYTPLPQSSPMPLPSSPSIPTSHPAAASPTVPSGSVAAGSPWLSMVQRLDAARAKALMERDPALLAAVYTDDCPALSADKATIASLVEQQVTIEGASHRIVSVEVRGVVDDFQAADSVTVVVTDTLPSYRLLAHDGTVMGRTTARDEQTHSWVLRKTADGFRIDQIRSA